MKIYLICIIWFLAIPYNGYAQIQNSTNASQSPLIGIKNRYLSSRYRYSNPEVKNVQVSRPISIEGKAAYFYPTNHLYRKIYSGGGLYGLELNGKVYSDLYGWTSVNILYSKGKSYPCGYRTDIAQVPIDLGVKYAPRIDRYQPYVGVGVLTTYMHIHDHAAFVKKKIVHWGVGAIFKVGCLVELPQNLFLDFFTNYSSIWVNPPVHRRSCPHKANLSGFSFGGGLGYGF